MEYSVQFHKLCQIEARRYALILGMVAITYLMLQSVMLPYGKALKSLYAENEVLLSVKSSFPSSQLLVKSAKEGDIDTTSLAGMIKKDDQSNGEEFINNDNGSEETDISLQEIVTLEGEGQDKHIGIIEDTNNNENGISAPESVDQVQETSTMLDSDNIPHIEEFVGLENQSSSERNLELNKSLSSDMDWNQTDFIIPEQVEELPLSDRAVLSNDSPVTGTRRRKKVRAGMPPISVLSIDKMNRILARHLTSSSKMKSQGLSRRGCDKEILDAKWKIINARVSNVDKELYSPVFRNVSMFMRSYELMEQTLKVYIYRDGKKPIFHQPILKGLYASEGWFMKLMEGNKHFVVKNPEKAHLFYMPFSSRMLEYALYVPNSHNRTNLRQFVKDYTQKIAAKYSFWNRTGGKDHFLVACHDWAPYETRHHMENSIKALCNADITVGFKIGRDVSLPETFIRYARNPLRDIGGKPPSKRNILAFYAGNSHGYLRPTLLKHWKDDPDMRIYGLLPTRVSRKMNYIQHMKSSKYCICPKGFEVNSPRIVEAIYYECVPIIISDNFVPPFFEVLNWDAFSVILAEKDIPNLKDILMSIPVEKYTEMQLAVRRVQQHFLWHARPVKFDLFHMTLHSIWYSRVFQI